MLAYIELIDFHIKRQPKPLEFALFSRIQKNVQPKQTMTVTLTTNARNTMIKVTCTSAAWMAATGDVFVSIVEDKSIF